MLEVPTPWLAKVRLLVETEAVGVAAVPLKFIVCVPALSVMVSVPVTVPALEEVKVTLSVQAAPTSMPVPQVLVWEKLAVGEGEKLVKLTAAVPVSVSVTI